MYNLSINTDWPKEGVKSISSEIIHQRPEQYLAELVMIHRQPSLMDHHFFWRDMKYKKSYMGFILELKTYLQGCDFKTLHNVIVKNKISSIKDITTELVTKEIFG
jgi:hypothetical protein